MSVLDQLTPEQKQAALSEAAEMLKNQESQIKQERQRYKELASEEVEGLFQKMKEACASLAEVKTHLFNSLQALVASKSEVYGIKDGQKTHTITTLDGSKRITIGVRDVSDWDGTESAGVEKIKKYIASLAKDDNSGKAVDGLMMMLKPDKKGQLDPRRVLDLTNFAEKQNDEVLNDGIRIITSAYRMIRSKAILLVEERVNGSWRNVELDFSDLTIVASVSNESLAN